MSTPPRSQALTRPQPPAQPSTEPPAQAPVRSLARRHARAVLTCPGLFAVLAPGLFLAATEVLAMMWPAAEAATMSPAPRSAGIILAVAGLGMVVWTNVLFHRHHGTLHPSDGPTRLVTTGPYAWTRNPMIIGIFGFLGGMAIVLGSWALAGYLVLFAIVKNFYMKLHEEPVLRERFGEAYAEYCRRMPRRWLPWPPRA